MSKVWLGLGGNIGDVRGAMQIALEQMQAHEEIEVTKLSHLYKTPPWGKVDQDWFLNACAEIETSLEPDQLLAFVKGLEKQAKREKTIRWGPRTLDIDLLIYNGVELDEANLTLPHPKMHERAFVLLPLSDIASELVIMGKSIEALLSDLDISQIIKVEDNLDLNKIKKMQP